MLRVIAQRFASANPSTMAALVAAVLLAGSPALAESHELDRAAALTWLERATQTIADRGKAELGDKTILDALVPTIDALRSTDEGPGGAARDDRGSAGLRRHHRRAVKARASSLGRERTIGHPDGGVTAYLRLLQALGQARQRTID
jgi:dihydroxyacetone kinase-like protein